MKREIGILLAMAGMFGTMNQNQPRYYNPDDDKPVKKIIPKGCKEFTYYGHTVYALNEARAIKKCKKMAGIN
ncbi:hypothetical protein [Mucilaginibacter sp. 10I4]|uniref:hypothetical protein n=1 Tax=Mucilaginibacter sp. 10I4 TaxID=3048580 RepID=UPI002B22CD76|nr:hypothetical protein [Mucilaginibacter sp. 10I4]MEB0262907.1 hypothetical protein [Mucilaginibacter sp. 10I4]